MYYNNLLCPTGMNHRKYLFRAVDMALLMFVITFIWWARVAETKAAVHEKYPEIAQEIQNSIMAKK